MGYSIVALAVNRNRLFTIKYYVINSAYVDLLEDWTIPEYGILSHPNEIFQFMSDYALEIKILGLSLPRPSLMLENDLVTLFKMQPVKAVEVFGMTIPLNGVNYSEFYEIYLSENYNDNRVPVLYDCDDAQNTLTPAIRGLASIKTNMQSNNLYAIQTMLDIDEEPHVLIKLFDSEANARKYLGIVKQGELGQYNFLYNTVSEYCVNNNIKLGHDADLDEMIQLSKTYNMYMMQEQVYLGRDRW